MRPVSKHAQTVHLQVLDLASLVILLVQYAQAVYLLNALLALHLTFYRIPNALTLAVLVNSKITPHVIPVPLNAIHVQMPILVRNAKQIMSFKVDNV
jgi:hypothetical protein